MRVLSNRYHASQVLLWFPLHSCFDWDVKDSSLAMFGSILLTIIAGDTVNKLSCTQGVRSGHNTKAIAMQAFQPIMLFFLPLILTSSRRFNTTLAPL